jgi:hypothetical protein
MHKKYTLGIQAGLNRSNIHATKNTTHFDKDEIYTPLIFMSMNGYLGYKSTSRWGVSIEPGFIQKGGYRTSLVLFDPEEFKYIFSYIQLPVLFDKNLFSNLFLSIGPEFAWLVKARTKTPYSSESIYDEYNKFEVAGIAGLYYNLFRFIDLGIRYDHGLINPTKHDWSDDFGNLSGQTTEYNQYFQIILRVKI